MITSYPHYKLSSLSLSNNALPLKRSRLRLVTSEQKPRKNLELIKIIKPIDSPVKVKSIKGYSSYNSSILFKKLKSSQIKRNRSFFIDKTASEHQTPKRFDTINQRHDYEEKIISMRKCFGPYSFLAEVKNPFLHIQSNFIKIAPNQSECGLFNQKLKITKNQRMSKQCQKIHQIRNFNKLKYSEIPFKQFIADSDQQGNNDFPIPKYNSQKYVRKRSKNTWNDKMKLQQVKIFKRKQAQIQNRWQIRQQQDQNMNFF